MHLLPVHTVSQESLTDHIVTVGMVISLILYMDDQGLSMTVPDYPPITNESASKCTSEMGLG